MPRNRKNRNGKRNKGRPLDLRKVQRYRLSPDQIKAIKTGNFNFVFEDAKYAGIDAWVGFEAICRHNQHRPRDSMPKKKLIEAAKEVAKLYGFVALSSPNGLTRADRSEMITINTRHSTMSRTHNGCVFTWVWYGYHIVVSSESQRDAENLLGILDNIIDNTATTVDSIDDIIDNTADTIDDIQPGRAARRRT